MGFNKRYRSIKFNPGDGYDLDITIKVFNSTQISEIPIYSDRCGIIVRNVFDETVDGMNIGGDDFYDKVEELCLKYHYPYIEVNAKTGENFDVMMEQLFIQYVYYGVVNKMP